MLSLSLSDTTMKRYWLLKSEPDSYSIDDLERDGKTHWNGVRNYQARNLLRDEIQKGDGVLYYHSNANPPGVVGLGEIVRAGYPDPSARDKKSDYYDPKASDEDPRWYMVDVGFKEKFSDVVGLPELKENSELSEMVVTRRSRLSVQPVTPEEWKVVVKLGRNR